MLVSCAEVWDFFPLKCQYQKLASNKSGVSYKRKSWKTSELGYVGLLIKLHELAMLCSTLCPLKEGQGPQILIS